MNAIPGRRSNVVSRWLVYFAALLVALGATALLLSAAEPTTPAASAAPAAPAAQTAPGSTGAVYCPVCGTENRAGSKFCRKDGTALPAIEPGRRPAGFVRAPGTYSPEEVQEVMQRVSRSVVRIRVRATTTYKFPRTWWKDDTAEYYRRAMLGKIDTSSDDARSAGSGFVIAPKGEIVTNAHVATPDGMKADLTVETEDGRSFPARLIGADPASDLALITIDNDEVPPLEWGDSNAVKVGQETWAIGNPLDIGISITRGTISSIAGTRAGFNQIESFLHSDAHITHGNSGGPLVDVFGHVVGVSDIAFTESKGQGYSIPSTMARIVIDRLRRDGRYERGYVGAIMRTIDADMARKYGLTRTIGTVVDVVLPGGAAEKAGLQPGDVVYGVNGRQTSSSYQLQEAVSSVGPSIKVTFTVERKGKQMEIPATTALRPAAPRGDPLVEMQGYLRLYFEEDAKHGQVIIRDPNRSRRAPGLWEGTVVKSVLPAQDWPEETITLNYYRTRAKPTPVRGLDDLRKALMRAYLGGYMAATFEIDYTAAPIASVRFDELWPILL
jgi:S1-C subfamily serine protease